MNQTAKIARGLALILALLLVAAAAPAQLAKLAEPDPHPGGVAWATDGDYASLELVVSGPEGFYLRQEFGPGEIPSIDLGSELPDGEYTWELVAMPSISPALAEEMAAAAGDPALRDDLSFDLPKRRTTSGFFRVLGGAIVQPAAEPAVRGGAGGDEGPSRASDKQVVGVSEADQVILDDLIVDGSICAGQDCVNGESFGFDTLRLKENNLRIKAQDTSSTASFPSNDWQITFNDSSNGGQNKFSIDDIDGGRTPFTIEAGAPSNALYVEDSGELGLGTNSPVVEVHIKDGDTPTLRLEQDGSSGFTPQTWDLAGNETNFFVRDVTNGSRLPFRITPAAPTNSLFVAADGDVGIGTNSPAAGAGMQLVSTAAENFWIKNPSPGNIWEESDSSQDVVNALLNSSIFRIVGFNSSFTEIAAGVSLDLTDGNVGINCTDGGTLDLTVGDGDSCAGTFTGFNAGDMALTASSSRSIKENLQEVAAGDILQKINAVDVYTYDFIEGPKGRMGLMAEDFHQVFERGSDKMLNNGEVQMALWLAVQQLSEKVAELEAELAAKNGSQ